MNKKNQLKKTGFLSRLEMDYANKKLAFFVYVILNLLVIALLILQILRKNYAHVFTCSIALILFSAPSVIECVFKVNVPSTLKAILMLFIFTTQIMGEVLELYVLLNHWDTLMHIISGFFCAAFGLSIVDLLNQDRKILHKLSPVFAVLVAFCFSMTISVLWEFFEFGADMFMGYDMQKDTWITNVTSVSLHPEGKNTPVSVDIDSVVINGEEWPAYLDIGLTDTMKDLGVCAIGSLGFSVFGYLYIKRRSTGRFMQRFLLTRIRD